MKRKFLRGLLVMLAVLLMAGGAQAAAISTDVWYGFSFTGIAPQPTSGFDNFGNATDPGATPWTYTSASATSVTVTDLQLDIDYFSLYDFGVLVGSTPFRDPDPSGGAPDCGYNPDFCIAAGFSNGTFLLGAGSHSLTITQLGSSTGGVGAFRVGAAVPEPGTLTLLGAGLFGLVAYGRRRKK